MFRWPGPPMWILRTSKVQLLTGHLMALHHRVKGLSVGSQIRSKLLAFNPLQVTGHEPRGRLRTSTWTSRSNPINRMLSTKHHPASVPVHHRITPLLRRARPSLLPYPCPGAFLGFRAYRGQNRSSSRSDFLPTLVFVLPPSLQSLADQSSRIHFDQPHFFHLFKNFYTKNLFLSFSPSFTRTSNHRSIWPGVPNLVSSLFVTIAFYLWTKLPATSSACILHLPEELLLRFGPSYVVTSPWTCCLPRESDFLKRNVFDSSLLKWKFSLPPNQGGGLMRPSAPCLWPGKVGERFLFLCAFTLQWALCRFVNNCYKKCLLLELFDQHRQRVTLFFQNL